MLSERIQEVGSQASQRRRGAPGFTLLEMLVTVAIMGVVAALAYSSYNRDRPRRLLSSTAEEIQGAIKTARTKALSEGRDAAVLFYPAQATGTGIGRVVVYLDLDGGFMQGTPLPGLPSFCTFDSNTLPDPTSIVPGPNRKPRIQGQIDLSRPVLLSVPAGPVAITFPYNTVPAPLTGCSFCAAGGAVPDATGVPRAVPGPGAIRFDANGRATFYSTCGAAGPSALGGSISLTAPGNSGVSGTYVLVVTPAGIVRIFNAG